MNEQQKEKPPIWFPIAPIMVVICLYLIILLSNGIVDYFDLPRIMNVPILLRLLLGLPLISVGLTFFVWGFSQLRPAAAIGFALRLRTTGAYGLTRNPMYFGLNSALWGTGLIMDLLPILIAAFVWSSLNFLTVTIWEEKQMLGKFGNEYLQYKKEVPRFLPVKLKKSKNDTQQQ
jgi:protein-S-isoprenylcysteine O-methyltransferase Ste14